MSRSYSLALLQIFNGLSGTERLQAFSSQLS
nr:MAG TPA: hypothetical protein [Caudoviricetes sp.]